jgi:hypothetical protein
VEVPIQEVPLVNNNLSLEDTAKLSKDERVKCSHYQLLELRRYEHENNLRYVMSMEMKPLFTRAHLNRELIIGFVGARGGGKSGSGAVTALLEFMFSGLPVFSNMVIACDISVDDETAGKYGVRGGGIVHFRSIPLNKKKLLRFDPIFKKSCIFIDEINVEFSESRRSMSTTNLFMNRVSQELRHYETSMIYTCLSEMALDSRIRDNTDIFIKTKDTALSPSGLQARKPIGLDFEWLVYSMSDYLGSPYCDTHVPYGKYYLNFEPFRGIYNDKEIQGEGMYKYGVDLKNMDDEDVNVNLQIQESPMIRQQANKWQWFDPIVEQMLSSPEKYILAKDIQNNPEVIRRRLTPGEITKYLQKYYPVKAVTRNFRGIRENYYELGDEEYREDLN